MSDRPHSPPATLSRALLWAALLFGIVWLGTWVADEKLGLGPVDSASVARVDDAATASIEATFFARLKTSFGLLCVFSGAGWLLLRTSRLPAAAAWSCRLAVVALVLVGSDRISGWWQPLQRLVDPSSRQALTETEARALIERQARPVAKSSPLRLDSGYLPAAAESEWRVASLSRVGFADGEVHLHGLFRRSRPPSMPGVLRLDGHGEVIPDARTDRIGELMIEVRDFYPLGERTVLLGRSRYDLDRGILLPHASDAGDSFDPSFTDGFLEVFDRVEHLRRLPDGRWLAAGRLAGRKHFAVRRFEEDGRPETTWAPGRSHRFILHLWTFDDGRSAVLARDEIRSIIVLGARGGELSRFELSRDCHGLKATPLADGSWLVPCRRSRDPEARLYTVRRGESRQQLAERLLGSTERLPELVAANRFLDGPFELRPGQPLQIPRATTDESRQLPPWPENDYLLERWSADGELLFSLRYPLPGAVAGVVPAPGGRFSLLGFRRRLSARGAVVPTEGLLVGMSLDGAAEHVRSLGSEAILTRLDASLPHPGGGFFAAGPGTRGSRLQRHADNGRLVYRSDTSFHAVQGLWPAADGGLWLTQELKEPPHDGASSLRLSVAGRLELDAAGRPKPAPPIPAPEPPPWALKARSPGSSAGVYEKPQQLSDGRWMAVFRPWSSNERLLSLVRLDAKGQSDEAFARQARQTLEVFARVRDTSAEPKPKHRVTQFREDPEGRILVVLSSGPRLPETLLRLHTDGQLDRDFKPPGRHIERVHDLAVAPDGTIYVTGQLRYRGETYGLMRLSGQGRALSFSHGPSHPVEGPLLTVRR